MMAFHFSMQGEDILMVSVMCLHSNMQEADVFEYTKGKCHLCKLLSQLVNHCVT